MDSGLSLPSQHDTHVFSRTLAHAQYPYSIIMAECVDIQIDFNNTVFVSFLFLLQNENHFDRMSFLCLGSPGSWSEIMTLLYRSANGVLLSAPSLFTFSPFTPPPLPLFSSSLRRSIAWASRLLPRIKTFTANRLSFAEFIYIDCPIPYPPCPLPHHQLCKRSWLACRTSYREKTKQNCLHHRIARSNINMKIQFMYI